MLLNRDFFADKLDTVKDCKECIVPIQITSISEDAFLDWYNIQYIVLHPGIKVLPKNSFLSDNLKLIIGNIENIEDFKEVTILPYTDYYEIIIKMYDISATMEEIISFNDLSKEDLEKRKADYNAWVQSLINELNKKQSNLSNEQDAYLKNLAKMEVDISKYYENMQEVLEKIRKIKSLDQEYIKTLESQIDTIINSRLVNVGQQIDYVNSLVNNLKQLSTNEFDNYKRKLEEIKKELNAYFSKEIDDIEEKSTDLFNSMNLSILESFKKVQDETDKIVKNIVDKAMEQFKGSCRFKTVVININNIKTNVLPGQLFHNKFEEVVKVLSLRLHPLLVGPAGSGKNVILEQAAKALKLNFYYVNDVTEEHKVMGFVDANGKFQQTQFFKAFTKGGLIMIDEMDNSHPSALLAINAALGTGYHQYLTFPDGILYESNPDFYLAAAANTYGTGSDQIYCGRSSLDGASLNRFLPIFIDYDKNLEQNLVKNTSILNLFWQVRESINKNKIRHVISTRNIVNADRMLNSNMFTINNIFDYTIIQSMSDDDLRMILKDLVSAPKDNYIVSFINYLKMKGINLNEYNQNASRTRTRQNDFDSYGFNHGGFPFDDF